MAYTTPRRHLVALVVPAVFFTAAVVALPQAGPTTAQIVEAFGKQGIRITAAEAARIAPNVARAVADARAGGIGKSRVTFAAVEIASDLGLDTSRGSNTVKNVSAAIGHLTRCEPVVTAPARPDWAEYFRTTTNLWQRPDFLQVVQQQKFFPVKISWEDIGRYQNSAWGDRSSWNRRHRR